MLIPMQVLVRVVDPDHPGCFHDTMFEKRMVVLNTDHILAIEGTKFPPYDGPCSRIDMVNDDTYVTSGNPLEVAGLVTGAIREAGRPILVPEGTLALD